MKSAIILLLSICIVSSNICTTEDQDIGSALSTTFKLPGYTTYTQIYLLYILADQPNDFLYFIGYYRSPGIPWDTIIYKTDHSLEKIQVVTYTIYSEYFTMTLSPRKDFLYLYDRSTDSIVEIRSEDLGVVRLVGINSATINSHWHIEARESLFFSFIVNSVAETWRWDMVSTSLEWMGFGTNRHTNFAPITNDLLFFGSMDTMYDQYYLINYNFSDPSNLVWKKSIACPTSGWVNKVGNSIVSRDNKWIYAIIIYDDNFIFHKLSVTDGSPQNSGFIWKDSQSINSYSMDEFAHFIAFQIQSNTLSLIKRLALININNTGVLKEYKSVNSNAYFVQRILYKGEELMYHSGRDNLNYSFLLARSLPNSIDQLQEFEEDVSLFSPITSNYKVLETLSSPSVAYSNQILSISTSTSITATDITGTIDTSLITHVALWNQDYIESVQSNTSVQLNFSWAWAQFVNYTDIVFSLAQTGSDEIPEWVIMDPNKKELYLNTTPKLNQDTTFNFSLKIAFNSEVYYKRFEITVEQCSIMNCEVWQLDASNLWETWTTDYEASDNQRSCSKITSMPGATEAAAAMVTSSVVLASASSMLSLSSVNSIFSIMNSLQLAVLLPLVPDYISPKVLDFLSSMGFTMFSFDFIKFKDIPFVEAISNWVSYPQSDEYLNSLGMRSGSSVVNYLSLMVVIILVRAIHLGILWWYLCTENSKHKKCNKFLGALLMFLTFNIYIRIFIQAFSFTTLSIFSELYTFNLRTTVTKVSLGLWIVFGLCTSVLFILSFIMYAKSFPEFDKKKYWPWVEYFNGIKPTKFSKLYSSLFMLLRLLLSSLLIFGATVSGSTKGTYFYLLNIVYWLYLVGVRPFENAQDSVIEIINQTMFCCLAVPLSWLNTKESWTPFYESYYTTIFMVSPAICSLVWLIFLIKSIVISIIKWKRNKAKTTVTPKEPSPNSIKPQDQEDHNHNQAQSVSGQSSNLSKSNAQMIHIRAPTNPRQRKLARPSKVKISPKT